MNTKAHKHFFAVLILACQSSAWAHSVDQGYRAVQVLGGDTVKIEGKERTFTCRLHGVVAPRTDLMSGQVSKESLAELVFGRDVHVHVMTTVERGVLGCRVFVKGEDLSRQQLMRGMVSQSRDITVDAQLLYAENHAKTRRLGLWSGPEPALPVE